MCIRDRECTEGMCTAIKRPQQPDSLLADMAKLRELAAGNDEMLAGIANVVKRMQSSPTVPQGGIEAEAQDDMDLDGDSKQAVEELLEAAL
eukprot:4552433-Karenia_brevis.AAC.1